MNRRDFARLSAATLLFVPAAKAAPQKKLEYGILARSHCRSSVYHATPDYREEKDIRPYNLELWLDDIVVYCPELKIVAPVRMRILEIPNRPMSPVSSRENHFEWIHYHLHYQAIESKDFKFVSLSEFERLTRRSVFERDRK